MKQAINNYNVHINSVVRLNNLCDTYILEHFDIPTLLELEGNLDILTFYEE